MIRTLLHHLRRPNPDALFDLRRERDQLTRDLEHQRPAEVSNG